MSDTEFEHFKTHVGEPCVDLFVAIRNADPIEATMASTVELGLTQHFPAFALANQPVALSFAIDATMNCRRYEYEQFSDANAQICMDVCRRLSKTYFLLKAKSLNTISLTPKHPLRIWGDPESQDKAMREIKRDLQTKSNESGYANFGSDILDLIHMRFNLIKVQTDHTIKKSMVTGLQLYVEEIQDSFLEPWDEW